jgi:hypothetical protein
VTIVIYLAAGAIIVALVLWALTAAPRRAAGRTWLYRVPQRAAPRPSGRHRR